ncbi:MAG: hypothetical protein DHS20C10_09570 [marine bacterium B5-7]|nr:MAG: hypothetical protein DHS20C10_09570 [marine bacterium B5-7]
MADKQKKTGNARTRVILIVAVVLAIVIVAVSYFSMRVKQLGIGSSASLSAPPSIESIPGSDKATAQYIKIQEKQNQDQAVQALHTGGSAVPTILRQTHFDMTSFNSAKSGYGGRCGVLQNKFPYCFNGEDDSTPMAMTKSMIQRMATIAAACARNKSNCDCQSAMDDAVKSKDLTNKQAKQLLKQYGKDGVCEENGDKLVNKLLADGRLSADIASQIKAACHPGVPRSVCEAVLKRLEAEGKLSPALAKQLEAAYGAMAGTGSAGDHALDQLIKMGHLTPAEAASVAQACKPGVPKAVCQAAIQRLLAEGKLTPAEAKQLMAAYGADHAADTAGTGEKTLAGMLSGGALSAENSAKIAAACKPGMSRQQCAAEIQRLEAEGKLSAAQAGKLLAAYGATHAVSGQDDKQMVAEKGAQAVQSLLDDGSLSPAQAAQMEAACRPGMSREACAKAIQALGLASLQTPKLLSAYGAVSAANKLLSPGQHLLNALQETGALSASDKAALAAACKKGMPREVCAEEIKRLLAEGKLTAAQARKLLAAYGATNAAGDLSAPAMPSQGDESAVANIPTGHSPNANLQRVLAQQDQYLANQQQQQKVQQLQQAMSTQAASLFTAWQPHADQQFVAGAKDKHSHADGSSADGDGNGGTDGAGSSDARAPADAKAGYIEFGVLKTAVNSDQPGPVMATLVQGKFKGAKLLGNLHREEKRVVLTFNIMNLPQLGHSIKINAVAIDPNTARTALATHVNSHYLLRYGTMFASAFLTGYGQVVQQAGSTTTTNGLSTQVSTPDLSPKQQYIAALGQVGQQWGDNLQNVFNTPPTVKVASGTGLGILFLDDVSLQGAKPGEFTSSSATGGASNTGSAGGAAASAGAGRGALGSAIASTANSTRQSALSNALSTIQTASSR